MIPLRQEGSRLRASPVSISEMWYTDIFPKLETEMLLIARERKAQLEFQEEKSKLETQIERMKLQHRNDLKEAEQQRLKAQQEFQQELERVKTNMGIRNQEIVNKMKLEKMEMEGKFKKQMGVAIQRLELEKYEAQQKFEREKSDMVKGTSAIQHKMNMEKMEMEEIDRAKDLNIAVIGQAGVGKSSLVNALRGLESDHEDAAKVDIVECTHDINSYRHPKFHRLVFWDVPGAGTKQHPIEGYYEDNALHAFDAILIVTGDRILDIDIEIAKQAIVVKHLAKSKSMSMDEAANSFRHSVNQNFQQELRRSNLSGVKIMMVSSVGFLEPDDAYTNFTRNSRDETLKGMDEISLLCALYGIAASRFAGSSTGTFLMSLAAEFIQSCDITAFNKICKS